MKTRTILSSICICCFSASLFAQSVGLVLSGGGAKGIAHIGVIQALEDNDIPIDYITGTSMGSIVGGLYSAGFTPAEMMTLLLSKDFSHWSTGQIDESLVYYFSKPSPTPAIANLNLNFSDSAKITTNFLPKSLINPLPMNFAFMELFAAYTAQCGGNFNNLFIPFRCVASDVYHKHKIVCSSGDLGNAIRASMSFPIVFKPIKLNGVYAFDGGIYDNFPVDVMEKDFAPAMTIGIDVSSGTSSLEKDNLIDQIEAMIMQPQNDSIASDKGIKININLHQFGLLDFPKAQAIYQIGYDKAMEYMDSIKARVSRRIPAETVALRRNVFKSHTPKVIFDSISVTGGGRRQDSYLEYIFNHDEGKDSISMNDAKISFYRVISSGKVKELLPQSKFNKKNGLFNLNMETKSADNFGIGVGGYITSSTNSMIFLSARYQTLSFNSFDAAVSGWIGQSYMAGEFNAKISLLTDNPSDLHIQGVMSRQRYYESEVLFYSDNIPSFILNYDNFIRLKYGLAVKSKSRFEIGIGYGYLKDKFYPSNTVDYNKINQDEARYKLGQVYASIETNSLNTFNYPVSGRHIKASIMGVYGSNRFMKQGIFNGSESKKCYWGQAEFEGSKYWTLSNHFTLGTKWDIIASTKKLYDNYTATVIQAPAFQPTPATKNYFNPAFRANSFVAAGILPIWRFIDNFHLRTEFYAFVPFQKLEENAASNVEYSQWFHSINFIAEASLVYSLPFASLSIYGNYLSYPARNWNFGISFGFLIPAQKFLK
ncbi:MAG: patatin-like phospholipase family protein [Muribaculaceae bacterium]|nr:patatin-like phospholipase family protein [Muribaculaceae bacterium]